MMKVFVFDSPWPIKWQKKTAAPGVNFPTMPVEDCLKREYLMEKTYLSDEVACSISFAPYNVLFDEVNRDSILPKKYPFIVWDKRTIGLGWVIRRTYEFIIIRSSESWKPNWALPSVLPMPRTDYRYQTSKPIPLLTTLLDAFVKKDEDTVVYDAYPGGRGLEVACKCLGLKYSSFDEV